MLFFIYYIGKNTIYINLTTISRVTLFYASYQLIQRTYIYIYILGIKQMLLSKVPYNTFVTKRSHNLTVKKEKIETIFKPSSEHHSCYLSRIPWNPSAI